MMGDNKGFYAIKNIKLGLEEILPLVEQVLMWSGHGSSTNQC